MDNYEKFLESLSLDANGISQQFMSFAAFFNILAAALMGFLVLAIYLFSSGRERRDRNLYMVIPVLSVLMAVMMRVSGPQAVAFFGIFGIMSVIRFRSDITDQKGITFILFAVIEGVIVGVNAYMLAVLAWLVVSAAILTGRYFFSHRVSYRLVLRCPLGVSGGLRGEAAAWFESKGIRSRFLSYSASSERNRKGECWEEFAKVELALFPDGDSALISAMAPFMDLMKERGVEVEFKRNDPS